MQRVIRSVLSGLGLCAVGATMAASDSPLASGGETHAVVSGDSLDIIHVFSYKADAQTFANTSGKSLPVRYLAVGAGGCGGSVKGATSNLAGGGGGGGGGVAEALAELSTGEVWSISVGKGSVSSSTGDKPYYSYGTVAGDTAISNATGEVICVPGGGLGGNSKGATEGAAGGGVYGYKDSKIGSSGTFASYTLLSSTPQGPYAGGSNASAYFNGKKRYWLSAGGGGAGGTGQTPAADGEVAGHGGAGIPCDITGTEVYYGAGGGGGGCVSTNQADCSGILVKISGGVGGAGAGNGGTFDGETVLAATSGTDGLGAGGGGGLRNTQGVNAVGGSGGHGTVIVRYHYSNLNPLSETPAFPSIGAAGEVTVRVAGAVEGDRDGKLWLKPGCRAVLYAVDAGGNVLSGWEDDETGEFIRGEVVSVTPPTRRSYTAVFGKPWIYDNYTLTNGDWMFKVTSDKKLYGCSQAPADTVLNLATPMYTTDGSAYRLAGIGRGQTEDSKIIISTNVCETVRLFLPEDVQVNTSAFNAMYSAGVRGSVSIPRGVTVLGQVFQGCQALTNLYFEGAAEGGQTIFGDYGVCDDCRNLTRVGTLPSSVGELARHSFYRCAFMSIEMPGVTNLNPDAFWRVPLTNVVFGTNAVSFGTYGGEKGDDVYANRVFQGVTANCCFRFPGKAPILKCTGTNTTGGVVRPFTGGNRNRKGETVSSAMFGSTSGVKFYGSWRADPDGWRKVREEVGSFTPSGLQPPELDRSAGERRVRGVFYWSHGDDTPYRGWLIDAAMPGEPSPPGMTLLVR